MMAIASASALFGWLKAARPRHTQKQKKTYPWDFYVDGFLALHEVDFSFAVRCLRATKVAGGAL